jgi:hypothetical protein
MQIQGILPMLCPAGFCAGRCVVSGDMERIPGYGIDQEAASGCFDSALQIVIV